MHVLTILLFSAAFIPSMVILLKIPSFTQARRILAVEYARNCDGKTYPYVFENFTFIRNGSVTLCSGQVTATREFPSPIPTEFQVIKCDKWTDHKSCKLNNKFRWQDLCDFTKLALVPFIKSVMDEFEPPIRCPIKKCRYTFSNIKVETDTIAAVLGQNNRNQALWIMRSIMRDRHEEIVCYDIGLRITNSRIRL